MVLDEHSGIVKVLPETELKDRLLAAASKTWGSDAAHLEIRNLRQLHGGVSSLTYFAEVLNAPEGGPSWVVKIAPPGLEPVRNRDVLRQSRLMRYINEHSSVPVPHILLESDGSPPLFVMEYLPGQSYEPLLDEDGDPPTPQVVTNRAFEAARALAEMQAIETRDLHTTDSVIQISDELERWAKLLTTVPDELVPRHEELYRVLARQVPQDLEPVLVHGDFRLANMMFSGPRLNGIIDWEIWSLGDPRIDLAWLIMHNAPAHRFIADRSEADTFAGTGMPSTHDLLEQYGSAGGQAEAVELNWFLGYSYYKVASTLSVIVKRNLNNLELQPHLAVAAQSLPEVVEQGLNVMALQDN